MMTAALMAGFASCSSDDDEPVIPNPDVPTTSAGVYVLNNGNLTSKIEGSLSYFDYANGQTYSNLFQGANGRSLGNEPQCAMVYGSKIYIGVYTSNTIEILDAKTYKSIKQISLAHAEGQQPRSMKAKDGKIYISMYNGYVSRLDTLTQTIDKSVKVGPNPEKIAIVGNDLYVPNSDGMNWKVAYGKTASKIDLSSFTVTNTFEVGLNPTMFASNGHDLFLLCMGNYRDVAAKVYKVNTSDLKLTEVAEATLLDIKDNAIYMINAPYGIDKVRYFKYDITSGNTSDLIADEGVESPAAIAVDPLTGKIIISSYVMDGGYASHSLPGYAKVYSSTGVFESRFNTGVGPTLMFFNLN